MTVGAASGVRTLTTYWPARGVWYSTVYEPSPLSVTRDSTVTGPATLTSKRMPPNGSPLPLRSRVCTTKRAVRPATAPLRPGPLTIDCFGENVRHGDDAPSDVTAMTNGVRATTRCVATCTIVTVCGTATCGASASVYVPSALLRSGTLNGWPSGESARSTRGTTCATKRSPPFSSGRPARSTVATPIASGWPTTARSTWPNANEPPTSNSLSPGRRRTTTTRRVGSTAPPTVACAA